MGFLYSQLFVTPQYPTQSFAGQTIIVTGSNVGLGKEAARHFARLKAAKIILAVRNISAGKDAKQDIIGTTKRDQSVIEVWPLDLGNYDSIKAFAKRANEELNRIDVLVANASVAGIPFEILQDAGYETHVAVNVVGTYLLTFLMLPQLKRVASQHNIQPRLTVVVSEVHGWTKFPERSADNIFESMNQKDNMEERYPTSKLLQVMINRELAPKIKASGVILNMVNPGLCHSALSRHSGIFLEVVKFFLARSTEVGGRTLVLGAGLGPESSGAYISDGKIDQDSLSDFVRSEDGTRVASKLYHELLEILEKAEPGVTTKAFL